MTLLVGIVAKDGVVLSADSQTTRGEWKNIDANKIAVVPFQATSVIVAGAGVVDIIDRVTAVFGQRAARIPTVTNDAIAACMVESVRQVIYEQPPFDTNKNITPEQFKEFWSDEDYAFELMVACFVEKPMLFCVSPTRCFPDVGKEFFQISGAGLELADYILRDYGKSEMGIELSSALSVYAIERVNAYNQFCSGRARVAVLSKIPMNLYPAAEPLETNATVLTNEEVKELSEIVLSVYGPSDKA